MRKEREGDGRTHKDEAREKEKKRDGQSERDEETERSLGTGGKADTVRT